MVRFSLSEVSFFFRTGQDKNLRLGQAFFNYFKCHRVEEKESAEFLNRLYNLDGNEAIKMIESVTDYNQ